MHRFITALLALSAALPAAAAGPFTNLYFFGDSLTDTGNFSAAYANLSKPPGAPAAIPGPPYDAEGRFSNGALYADVLAAGLGFQAQPSLGGNDYAFGGARTRSRSTGAPSLSLIDQVAQFRALPGAADPGALYVLLWTGANNLQDILVQRPGQPIPPTVDETLGDIGSLVNGLYMEGARNILVPNVPNLGRVPRVRELGGARAQAAATALAQGFNRGSIRC